MHIELCSYYVIYDVIWRCILSRTLTLIWENRCGTDKDEPDWLTVIIIHKLTSLTLKLMGEFPSKLDFEDRVIFALFLLKLGAFLKKNLFYTCC